MKDDEVKIRVCKKCDAPLPYYPKELNYFKKNKFICDDCIFFLKI